MRGKSRRSYSNFHLRGKASQSGGLNPASYFILHLLYDVMLIPLPGGPFARLWITCELFHPSLPGGTFFASYFPRALSMG